MRTCVLAILAGCADTSVDKPYPTAELQAKEVREKLRSSDFRQRLEGSKQIDKLEPEERLQVLLILSKDPQASTRLLAGKKLRGIADPRAKARLAEMRNDPDPDVRQLAEEP